VCRSGGQWTAILVPLGRLHRGHGGLPGRLLLCIVYQPFCPQCFIHLLACMCILLHT
jgi:hypothetical protein